VPTHVPVCVLGNHRDMGEHRVVLPDDIRELISGLNRCVCVCVLENLNSWQRNLFYVQRII